MKHLVTTPALLTLVLSATLYAQQPVADIPAPEAALPTPASEAAAQPQSLAPGDSRIRIVRLSEIHGSVQLDRNTGSGFEQTMQNMPIVEGSRLQTLDGFAEVEFEDNSTLRFAPNSAVEFPRLIRHASGAQASTINLQRGTAYVALSGNKSNELTITVAGRNLIAAPSSHLRIQTEPAKTEIAVMNGSAYVEGSAPTQINKHQTLELTATDAQPVLAKNLSEAPYDAWDKQAFDYQKTYAARGNTFAGSPYQYGAADLNYYGSFSNFGGCGTMWRPYLASAAWDPYGNGVWAYYASAGGYSWVSPYPWGWTPYHYGSWAYCNGVGWGWQPGGNWRNLTNVPATSGGQALKLAGGTPLKGPHPPSPPTGAHPSLVVANRAPLVVSTLKSSESFEFTKNSAGLGVPRGTLGDLGKISNGVEQHGSVARPVYAAPVSNAYVGAHSQSSVAAPMSLHQGQASSHAESSAGGWSHASSASQSSSTGSFSHSAPVSSGAASSGGSSGSSGAHK